MANKHKVVVVGAGFAGIQLILDLKGAGAAITLIDQRNHHLFQPLLYQVATTLLATSDIAWPIRSLFHDRKDVLTLLSTVDGVDTAERTVRLRTGETIPYDTLVLATGARHAYFGHDEWERDAPGLKTLEDATTIRRRLLLAFERAELETDPEKRRALMTFSIIGAGPTGVELAGIIATLAQETLPGEFRRIDTREARVLLVEAGPRVLAAFAPKLSDYAARALTKLGVEVRTGEPVTECTEDGIRIGREFIACRTVVWAAGVQASRAAEWVGAPADRAGRVMVNPDLTVPGHPEIFALGDTAHVEIEGKTVPGIAPAAKQEGAYAAHVIRDRLNGKTSHEPFRYRHSGNLATVGPNAAVIDWGRIQLKGRIAWWLWGIAHIYFLIGARSRLTVAISWLWAYLRGQHSARLITQKETLKPE
ncbi:NAD(P)/FAD-dependent oxidoreductase [Mesorhizobium sp. RP14(2022)]|uniref:NADH:ubiquinone reductase (non-electrogenic) n=1 Tax=Mesorhizobium liriopis TaxID=2953882 RepID=A0ABT1C0K2_9HYPH|nr:NAD(P)/FAD-dependent oxidoreductase [Mesorhizobium liriopis]MCO6048363.1 NAD(P)/FAD-dependent oxidoreductase [Mesorhizobium liriopis]